MTIYFVQYEIRPQPESDDFADCLDEPDCLEAFDEASTEGECYVLHLWPHEAQGVDVIH